MKTAVIMCLLMLVTSSSVGASKSAAAGAAVFARQRVRGGLLLLLQQQQQEQRCYSVNRHTSRCSDDHYLRAACYRFVTDETKHCRLAFLQPIITINNNKSKNNWMKVTNRIATRTPQSSFSHNHGRSLNHFSSQASNTQTAINSGLRREQEEEIAAIAPKTTTTITTAAAAKNKERGHTGQCSNIVIPCDTLFDLQLPEGRCVGLKLATTTKTKQKEDLTTLSNGDDHILRGGGEDNDDESMSLTAQAIEKNQNHWIRSVLHPNEIQFALDKGRQGASDTVSESFLLGRLAMRFALGLVNKNERDGTFRVKHVFECVEDEDDVDFNNNFYDGDDENDNDDEFNDDDDICILKDQFGRPDVPRGCLGSISHKNKVAVALIAPACTVSTSPQMGIGVDLEKVAISRSSVARRVLTKEELSQLGNVEGCTAEEEVLLRFSIKESLYKAMHPLICQFVGFQEASVQPLSDGTARVDLQLKSGAHERFADITVHWRREGDYFLTSSSVKLKE